MSNKSIIKVSYLIVALIIFTVFFYSNTFEEKISYCATPDPIDYIDENFAENFKEGRKLFKALCASCHKLDKKLIGPALARDDWEFDYFLNYTLNEEVLLKLKSIKAIKSNKDYLPYKYDHSFSQLSKEQVKSIFDYVNMAYLY